MTIVKNKSPHCLECKKSFTKDLPYWAQNKCNGCYQKLYKGGLAIKNIKVKPHNCSQCGAQFDSLNEKGKPIRRASRGMCKRCYHTSSKPTKVCFICGNTMLTGSKSGLCAVCKLNGSTVKTKKKNIKPVPVVDKEQFELIRRLLVRFKVGHNNSVDNFRVADIYMDINDNSILLDTLSEESQIVEMLRNLKSVFEHNLPLVNKIKKKKPKSQKPNTWYLKNKDRLKKERLLLK